MSKNIQVDTPLMPDPWEPIYEKYKEEYKNFKNSVYNDYLCINEKYKQCKNKIEDENISDEEYGKHSILLRSLEKEQKELSILQTFMPEQMSDEKIRSIAREIIAGGKSGFGAVMSAVMQQVKGKTDGGVVKKIVEETLTSPDLY